RSVGAGLAYNTTLGAGASVFWEHRNLFGNGENLHVAAGVAQKQMGLTATFRRPDIFARGLDYLSTAEVVKQTTDAYDSRRGRIYTGFEERALAPPWPFGGGLLFDPTILTKTDRPENYLLFGTPGYIRRDTSNNLLDPTTGTRSSVTVTPYHSLLGR